MAITDADRAHAAAASGLPADQIALIAGDTREELTGNACRVALRLLQKQRPAAKPPAESDDEAIDPAKLAAAIAKRIRF
ncbi:hypothetical protein [Streptomyces sp. NPDC058451]|uniref:hypothetical protein n=1 Tax=Streptomyces sp. NPDC058451 TaxID=3346506 RepID=UPI003654B7C7